MAECPVCAAEIILDDDAEEGEIIACEDCGSELEVTGKDSLREAPQEEEDWGEQAIKELECWSDDDFGFWILEFGLKPKKLHLYC